MKITMIGTGYVGLVTGTCLAEVGNDVLCLDVDARKIDILNQGGVPIHEPGLEAMVRRNAAAGRLQFTTDIDRAVAHGALQFIAVGTPPDEDGSADMQYVIQAARNIGSRMTEAKVIVDKSTVPVGTADRVRAAVAEELARRGKAIPFAVASNPEFLKEGAAVDDFMKPDRIVIGADDERAIAALRTVYAPFMRNHERLLVMDVRSAELTKYAANAMLATRISFMNEVANLADLLGADIEMVRQGIGSDPRIGYHFLYPGAGYGGSCFPKDVRALQFTATQLGRPLHIIKAVEAVNDAQKQVLVEKIVGRLGEDLPAAGSRCGDWPSSPTPTTCARRRRARSSLRCLRAARPSSPTIRWPWTRHAACSARSPACRTRRRRWPPATAPMRSSSSPSGRSSASADFDVIKARLKSPLIFDGRNLYDPAQVKAAGFEYAAIGRR